MCIVCVSAVVRPKLQKITTGETKLLSSNRWPQALQRSTLTMLGWALPRPLVAVRISTHTSHAGKVWRVSWVLSDALWSSWYRRQWEEACKELLRVHLYWSTFPFTLPTPTPPALEVLMRQFLLASQVLMRYAVFCLVFSEYLTALIYKHTFIKYKCYKNINTISNINLYIYYAEYRTALWWPT